MSSNFRRANSLAFLLAWSIFPTDGLLGQDGVQPNILIVYTDDQGYGDASCLNQNAKFQTPNIDSLAKDGLTFTDAHTSDAVCSPSRYGLLTGRYCWRTRLKRGVLGAEAACLIDGNRVTIADLLRQQGYATAMVGKWHLGMDFPGDGYQSRDWTQPVQDMPLDKGFDYFYGIPASLNYGVLAWFEGRYAKVPPTLFTAKKPNQRHIDYRIKPPYQATPDQTRRLLGKQGMEVAPDFVDNQCLTRFTDQAIKWLTRHEESNRGEAEADQQPFFLYLPLTSPHYPVCPLPQFHGQGAAGGYGEFMIETDYHLGRILACLDRLKLANNTLVIFSSDNGPETSWKQRVKQFRHHSNGQYREGKRSIYEGGHRVPMLMRWPDGICEPGREIDLPVCQTDILASVAEIVGADLEAKVGEDSQSFARLLRCASEPERDRAPMVHHAANGRFAIRLGNWKAIMPHGKESAELYDLASDPSESTDLAAEHPTRLNNLTIRLAEIIKNGRTTPGTPQPNDPYEGANEDSPGKNFADWADLAWLNPAWLNLAP